MSDEEKKAIEVVNKIRIDFFNSKYKEIHSIDELAERYEALCAVLNLIEKQDKQLKQKDKEIEDNNKEIVRLGKTANEYKKAINCKDCDCCVCDAHINTLELRAEIEKQDKIIAEAIKWIENTMNDPNIRGCNLGDLQLLLDILEGE
jgi:uncharacterized protein (DUF3084 family)